MGWQHPPADSSWDRSDVGESLDRTLPKEPSDAVRGYRDGDEGRR